MPTQGLEIGDVHFLDVREVRDIPLGLAHALCDQTAYADELDLFRRARGRSRRSRAQGRRLFGSTFRVGRAMARARRMTRATSRGTTHVLFDVRFEILPHDAAIGPRARYLAQIDASL